MDHINKLPDDILCFILKFLNLRDAVKTRLLSRRWRFLSSSPANLHLDLLSIIGNHTYQNYKDTCLTHKSKFLTVVDQFLQYYPSPKIDSFHVTFALEADSASHIDRWISFALGRDTTTISLDLKCRPYYARYYNFPCHLLPRGKNSHLKHLHLAYCTLKPSLDYSKIFNSLITLHISDAPLEQSHLEHILSGCLNLECLMLKNCEMGLHETLHIFGPLPSLKSLLVFDCVGFKNIELNSLQSLNIFQYIGVRNRFAFFGLPALQKVYLKFWNRMELASTYVFNELAKDLPKLEVLSLEFMPFVGLAEHESLSTFRHLKHLELRVFISPRFDVLSIVQILNAFPALQKFHLALYVGGPWKYARRKNLESEHPHLQLKEVEISGFSNTSNEIELVKYLLDNCISLKLMTVSFRGAGYILPPGRFGCRPNLEEVRNMVLQQRVDSSVEIIVR